MKMDMSFASRVWGSLQTFAVPTDGGYYNEKGRWVSEGRQDVSAIATILPLSATDLQFYEGGTYSTEDVKVFVIGVALLPIGTRFERNGVTYEIREIQDYAEFADLRRYVGKRLREVGP